MEIDSPPSFSVLSYNVWFREDVALKARMKAIADIIEQEQFPDFLCLQEVTQNIVSELRSHGFWSQYHASEIPSEPYFVLLMTRKDLMNEPPGTAFRAYPNSVMGRGLLSVRLDLCGVPLTVANTHLESPVPGDRHTKERATQLTMATSHLSVVAADNAVVCGDMNWLEEDGAMQLHLPEGWLDAWMHLYPGEPGATYDTRGNDLNKGLPFPPGRLDRLLYKTRDFEAASMRTVGTRPIDGVMADMQASNGRVYHKQVFPSDHYGIITQFIRK